MQIEQGRTQATITPCRGGLLVVIERTPHPGSGGFVRQVARRPWLTAPVHEEVVRRVVQASEVESLLLQEGLRLSRAEREALARLGGRD
ncbi:hypothetical protein DEIPH_ctg139orf0095 [Deinococcus phoenicis]|uniref:Uncharacterized protein n=1 Tax=Deinococcus phoenicis TaxID=1476583 RepID=A0A016QJL7_9DEIO|nr:hypothetical protein [Deinococcus phoenicis]EYB66370.1 hypothetical protein DEIPH_ctg139orf0095 [Deinococcus phoenicis]